VFAAEGIKAMLVNRACPTPLIMFYVQTHGLPYGMMVTASHNPAIYNGIKVFTAEGRDADKATTDELEALAATIAYAERGNMPLFNTGDLIDYDSHANVECIANSFADRNILSALGNHESFGHRSKGLNPSTPEEARALLEKYEKAYRQPLIVASKVINGVNFVAFDNGGLERYFLERRLAAIKAEFEKGLPVVLLCHIPLNNKDLDAPAVNGVVGDSFKNELRAHKNQIKAILCGHGHRERLGEWNGIPVALAGANFEGSAREIEFI
jgi:hypothetical protein